MYFIAGTLCLPIIAHSPAMQQKYIVGCCVAPSCNSLSQSTIIIIASCDVTYQGTLVAIILANNSIQNVWLLRPCVLRWLAYVARSLTIRLLLATSKQLSSLLLQYDIEDMLNVIASCAWQHIIYLIVAWWAIIAIPSQLSLASSQWWYCCIVVRPLAIQRKNIVVVARSSQYDMKNMLVVVVASRDRQFTYRDG